MTIRCIRNVTIVDGTGAEGYVGTVLIEGDRIVEVSPGERPHDADEVIDGTGMVICPGFIDPHTHYDAQVLWDPDLTPSNQHGVTTAIAGNCGFTLAPLVPGDAEYVQKMMAKVEGMPLVALETGVDWNWSTFAEYLNRLEGNTSLNIGFLVGHCAIRRQVMGQSAVGAEATPEQLAEMRRVLAASIQAGGLGFSTTLARTHSDGAGQPVASRWSTKDELLALAEEVSLHEGTTLEYASDGCLDGFKEEDIEFMIEFSRAGRRPLNWNVLTVDSHDPDRYQNQLSAMDRCAEAGAKVVALTMPIIVGMNMSFLNFCALNLMPDWGPILGLPLIARKACLRDREVRAFMKDRAASKDAGVFSRLTGWADYVIGDTYSAANEGLTGRRISDIAAERGTDPFDTLLDVVLEDELQTILWPGATDNDNESWELRAKAWEHPSVMIGGSDAGAHLDRMAGAPYPTKWLGDCLRGRQLTSMENAIRHMTSVPAELFGLHDRGTIEAGKRADLVLFDPSSVDCGPVVLTEDLPGGTARLTADAIGVSRVIVNGVDIVRDGVSTGERPGTVLRSGRDTHTVLVS